MADLTDVQVADRTHTQIVTALARQAHLASVMGAANGIGRTAALRDLADLLLMLALADDPGAADVGNHGLELLASAVGAAR